MNDEFIIRELKESFQGASRDETEDFEFQLRRHIKQRRAGAPGNPEDEATTFNKFMTKTKSPEKFLKFLSDLQKEPEFAERMLGRAGVRGKELRNKDMEKYFRTDLGKDDVKTKIFNRLFDEEAFKDQVISKRLNTEGLDSKLQDEIKNRVEKLNDPARGVDTEFIWREGDAPSLLKPPIKKILIKKEGNIHLSHTLEIHYDGGTIQTINVDELGFPLPRVTEGGKFESSMRESLGDIIGGPRGACIKKPTECEEDINKHLEGGGKKTRSERRNERRKEKERKKKDKDGFSKKWGKRLLGTGLIGAGAMIVHDAKEEHNIKSCQSLCNEHTYFCGPSPISSDSSITIQSYNDILNPKNFSSEFKESVDKSIVDTPQKFFKYCYENSRNGNIDQHDETNGCNIWKRYMCIIDNFHECYGNNIKDLKDVNTINCEAQSDNWSTPNEQSDSRYCRKPGKPACRELLNPEGTKLSQAFSGDDCKSCMDDESLYNKCNNMSNEEFYSVNNLVYYFMKYNDEQIKGCTQPINTNNDTLPCMPSRSELEKIDASAAPDAPKLADICSHRINAGQADQQGDIESEAFYLLGGTLPVVGTTMAVGGTIANAYLYSKEVSREYAIQQLSQIKNKHIQSKDEIDWVCNTVLPHINGNKGYTAQKIPKKVVDNMMNNAKPADEPFRAMSYIGNMFDSELTGNDYQDGWIDLKTTLSHTPLVGNLLDNCENMSDMDQIYKHRDKYVKDTYGECNNYSSPPIPCWDNPQSSTMLNLDFPNPEDLPCFKNSERSLSQVCNFQKNRYDSNLELTETLEDCFNSFTDLFTNVFTGPHSLSNIDYWNSFNNDHENNPSGNIPTLDYDGINKLINNNIKNKCSSKFLCHILTDNEDQCSHVLKFINNIFAVIFYILLIIYIIAVNKKIKNLETFKKNHAFSFFSNKITLIIIPLLILLNILYISFHSSNENSSIKSYTFKGFMEIFAYSDLNEAKDNAILHIIISILLGFIIYNIISKFIPINPIFLMIGLIFVIGGSLTGIGTLINNNNKDNENDNDKDSLSLGQYLLKYESLSTIIQLIVVLLILGHILLYGKAVKKIVIKSIKKIK
jgi:hypothetical protein